MGLPPILPIYQNQKNVDLANKIWKKVTTISTHVVKDFTFSSASRRCVAVQASPGRVGDFSHLNGTSLYKGCWLPG